MKKTSIISDSLIFEDYKNKLQISSLSNGNHIICIDKIDYQDLKRLFMR